MDPAYVGLRAPRPTACYPRCTGCRPLQAGPPSCDFRWRVPAEAVQQDRACHPYPVFGGYYPVEHRIHTLHYVIQ